METLEQFVKRLSKDIGCYYHQNQSRPAYSLKKYDTNSSGHMGVFGWVGERVTKDRFVISTYQTLADGQAIADADKKRAGAHYISKDNDSEGKATGLSYHVKRGSSGADYQKTVRALKVACRNRNNRNK